MAKSKAIDSLVGDELKQFEDKVQEFQGYLKTNSISSTVTKGGEITLSEENQDKLHKEIMIQIKMVYAVADWIPLLKKLRETEEDKIEVRGDGEVGGIVKHK